MNTNEKKQRIQLDMPCICSDEGKQDAADLRSKVSKVLEIDDQKRFVSNVVANLWWDYDCSIEGVYMDLWFGVAAEQGDDRYFVPCDRVEDGLAVLWEHFYNKDQDKDETTTEK